MLNTYPPRVGGCGPTTLTPRAGILSPAGAVGAATHKLVSNGEAQLLRGGVQGLNVHTNAGAAK